MSRHSTEVRAYGDLAEDDLDRPRLLFDSEYLGVFGAWDPEQPYGYASHDVYIIARVGDRILGHVGWARREISVGTEIVVVAGVGGVLITKGVRGHGLGALLMGWAAQSMIDHGGIGFGYLGCREPVVGFYASSESPVSCGSTTSPRTVWAKRPSRSCPESRRGCGSSTRTVSGPPVS